MKNIFNKIKDFLEYWIIPITAVMFCLSGLTSDVADVAYWGIFLIVLIMLEVHNSLNYFLKLHINLVEALVESYASISKKGDGKKSTDKTKE